MKKLFSNKDAERIEELESKEREQNKLITFKNREIQDVKRELEKQGKKLSDALYTIDQQRDAIENMDVTKIKKQISDVVAETEKQKQLANQYQAEVEYWKAETTKALKNRDNAAAGFERLKKKIERLETT